MLVPESVNEAIKHLSPKTKEEMKRSLDNLSFNERLADMQRYGFSKEEMKAEIEKANLPKDEKIDYMYAYQHLYATDEIKKELSNLSPEDRLIVRIKKGREKISDVVEDAYNDGLSKDEILELIENIKIIYNDTKRGFHSRRDWDHDIKQAKITSTKLTRDAEAVEYDAEYNTYVFIGFEDKKAVTVNGKKYYEDALGVEKIIKIDKFNITDLQNVGMMKIRAKVQYPNEHGAVYKINLPRDLFDEDSYSEIPKGFEKLFNKYKTKV